MTNLVYSCQKCGTCCFEIPNQPGAKRIPLYPEEVDKLISIAKEYNIRFAVKEDLVFPDELNSKIIVITYRIILEPSGHCPFFITDRGCSIHDHKPYACQAYPLSLKRLDAFQFEITIDPLCNFVINNYEELASKSLKELEGIFIEEFPKAKRFYEKNKKLQYKILKLEAENKIKIAREVTLEDFNNALKKWKRMELRVKVKKGELEE
ncbi:MAG: YkgJ family cysteine cluster protein [Candidatus Lokiarchaeota archaeon]|nr:YkgJ family cysteine cluster protein [Candidatus Lokiarchaeota archaeon]